MFYRATNSAYFCLSRNVFWRSHAWYASTKVRQTMFDHFVGALAVTKTKLLRFSKAFASSCYTANKISVLSNKNLFHFNRKLRCFCTILKFLDSGRGQKVKQCLSIKRNLLMFENLTTLKTSNRIRSAMFLKKLRNISHSMQAKMFDEECFSTWQNATTFCLTGKLFDRQRYVLIFWQRLLCEKI